MAKMSPARAKFLLEARAGVHAVESYAPAKWAIEKGYVTVDEGRFGSRMHRITPEGEAALRRAGEVG